MRGDKKSPQAICSLRRRGWGGRIRQGKPCRLQQFICPFCFAKDGLIGSNPAENLNKKITDTILCLLFFGWGGRIRQGKPCRLQQFICPFCFAKDGLIGSNPAKQSKQKNNRHSFVSVIFWLGWQDSNLRMQQSKCCVLPLDDTPILSLLSILIFQNILIFRKGI